MGGVSAIVIVIILATVAMLLAFVRLIRAGTSIPVRPMPAYGQLRQQVGRSVESGRRLHMTLGRAGLHGTGGATSVAVWRLADAMVAECAMNGIPPLLTVGEGTLLPAGQMSVRAGYEKANRVNEQVTDSVQFIADASSPMAYAAGVTRVLHSGGVANNIAVGRLGGELVLMGEAANREGVMQVMGSDDPAGMAVATALTNNTLIGEELFAAGAYLDETPLAIASLRVQDILRWLVAIMLMLVALLQIIGVL